MQDELVCRLMQKCSPDTGQPCSKIVLLPTENQDVQSIKVRLLNKDELSSVSYDNQSLDDDDNEAVETVENVTQQPEIVQLEDSDDGHEEVDPNDKNAECKLQLPSNGKSTALKPIHTQKSQCYKLDMDDDADKESTSSSDYDDIHVKLEDTDYYTQQYVNTKQNDDNLNYEASSSSKHAETEETHINKENAFRDFTTEEVRERFISCGLKKLASLAESKRLDGQFFSEVDPQTLHREPTSLSKIEMLKFSKAKDGWTPKL